MAWISLCELEELQEGRGKYVEIDGFHLAVFLNAGEVYVMDDLCPHAGASISAGWVEEGCAVCPWHRWAFQLQNGQLRGAPGVMVSTYKTRLFPHPSGSPILVQADLPTL